MFTHKLCKITHMRKASGDCSPPILRPAGQLIGAADDVREVATRLEAGTHLIVVGARRTGKTSVCEAALAAPRGAGRTPRRSDLFRVSDAASWPRRWRRR